MFRRTILIGVSIVTGLLMAVGALALLNRSVLSIAHAQILVERSSAGDLDPTFGIGGIVTNSLIPGNREAINDLALQPDGKIVAVGYSTCPDGNEDIALARYTTLGELDSSFGVGGVVTTSIGITSESAHDVILQPDGKIIVVGYTKINPSMFHLDHDMVMARYTSTGTQDSTFGHQGVVTASLTAGYDQAFAVALQPDNSLVMAGLISTGSGSDWDIALLRYTEDGILDASFGMSGVVTTSISNNDYARDVAVQPDGKIVVVGVCNSTNWAVVRYDNAGVLDQSFGSGGVICGQWTGGFDRIDGVALQSDGKIVAVGSTGNGLQLPQDVVVARYTITGAYDLSFNGSGWVTTTVGANNDSGSDMAIQPDGKLLASGQTRVTGHSDFLLVRYTSDGQLDASFGISGIVTTTMGDPFAVASAIARQADGRIVLAGRTSSTSISRATLARYLGATLDLSQHLYLPLIMR